MNTFIDGVDYGPLAQLIGRWVGDKGLDDAPDANAQSDKTPYIDELTFTVSGVAENAEEQNLVSVKYHHVVRKRQGGQIFHDQIGHWIYQPSNGLIMHSLTIPRGVCVLAGGSLLQQDNETIFTVEARADSDSFGIVQSPFMLEKAKTKVFNMTLSIKDQKLSYHQTMLLHIYGKDFQHSDKSELRKIVYDLD